MYEELNSYPEYGDSAYLNEMYELYLEGCKCDKEEDGCSCLPFDKFCFNYVEELKQDAGMEVYMESV